MADFGREGLGARVRRVRGTTVGLIVGAIAALLWLSTAVEVRAAAGEYAIDSVVWDEASSTLTVTLTDPAFAAWNGSSATGGLEASDFVLSSTTATIGAIAPPAAGGDTTFVLPIVGDPDQGSDTIAIAPGGAFGSAGQPFSTAAQDVPIDQTSLAAILDTLKNLDVPLTNEVEAANDTIEEVENLPLIGDWFANTGTDRELTDLLDGLAAIQSSAADTQAELVDALEGLDGIRSAAFDDDGLTLTFEDTVDAAAPTMSGDFSLTTSGITLSAQPTVGLRLDGTLRLLASGTTVTIDPATPPIEIGIDGTSTVTAEANVGFVELTGAASLGYTGATIALDLTCPTATPCAPASVGATTDVTGGTASIALDSVSLEDGSPPAQVFGAEPGNILEVAFGDITDLSQAPTVTDNLGQVANFNNLSLDQALASLQFLAATLAETEQFNALNADLPVVGTQLGDLVRAGQELGQRVSSVTSDIANGASSNDISAQDLVGLLCARDLVNLTDAQCATALTPLDITGDQISYRIELTSDRAEGTNPENVPAPDTLSISLEELRGFALSQVSGNIDISATGTIGLTLAFDIRPDSALMTAFGLSADDFDDDGIANGSDPDPDGDMKPNAEDTDDDGDGRPEDYTLAAGDLCRTLAGLAPIPVADQPANQIGPLTVDQLLTLNNVAAGAPCDDLLAVGTSVNFGSDADPNKDRGGAHVLTADDVCFAGASLFIKFDTPPLDYIPAAIAEFRQANGYADTAACAADVSNPNGPFNWDSNPLVFGSPVNIGHRAAVVVGNQPILTAGMTVTGSNLAIAGQLGFLDVALVGNVELTPAVQLSLVDPPSGPADGRVAFVEFARAIDASPNNNDALLAMTQYGWADSEGNAADGASVEAHFLVNNSLAGVSAKHIDVVGNFSAIDNQTGVFEFHETALPSLGSLDADRIHVGSDLGDFLNFEEISALEIKQLLRQFADRMVQLASSSLLDKEIPFVGSNIGEIVDFADRWVTVADQVLTQDPQTMSAFQAALNNALVANGMPAALTPEIDDDSLRFEINGNASVSRTFPFSLDKLDPGFGFSIAPADGGASVRVDASVAFNPTLGFRLGQPDLPNGQPDLASALFIENPNVTLSASLDADVYGTVNLGPLQTGISGHVSAQATGVVTIATGGDNRIDLDELLQDLPNLVTFPISGPINGSLEVTDIGSLTVTGNFDNLAAIDIMPSVDFDFSKITLDLDALVEGLIESTRFVGRTLAQSSALNIDLPLIGDAMDGAAALGTGMETLSTRIRELKRLADAKPVAEQLQFFVTSLQNEINAAFGNCGCATVVLLNDGAPATFPAVDEIQIAFNVGDRTSSTRRIDEGIGVDGVFEAGVAFDTTVEAGYAAGFKLGYSDTDGFYLEGGGPNGRLLSVFAGFNATGINGDVSIFDVPLAGVVNGSASLSGSFGQNNSAGISLNMSRLTLNDIVDRTSDIDDAFSATYDVNVAADLPLQTTSSLGSVPLPVLNVPLLFNWTLSNSQVTTPSLTLGSATRPITLDLASIIGSCDSDDRGALCEGLLAPVFQQIGEYNPFAQEPIRSILTGEIPVIEKSLLELAQEFGVDGANLFAFLASLDGTVPDVGAITSPGIDLGWVEVIPEFVRHANTTPWYCQVQTGNFYDILNAVFANLLTAPTGSCTQAAAAGAPAGGVTPFAAEPPSAIPTFDVGPLDIYIPLLDDPSKALGLLLGPDVAPPFSLIEVRFGSGDVPFNVGIGFNFSATLFELNTGFLDGALRVEFGGGLGLQFRLGIGYDTTGLRPGRSLLDGFYLVDFYNSVGTDVQELSVGGFVAGKIDGYFSVLAGLASVHFRGAAGINLTAGLDFFDESEAIDAAERGDGRFHLYEIGKVLEFHEFPGFAEPDYNLIDLVGFEVDDVLCIFQPSIDFSAYIQFSGSAEVAGVEVFDDSFSAKFFIIDIVNQRPLTVHCDISHRIAQIIDGQLVLNGGPEYSQGRYDGLGDEPEEFTIRREDSGPAGLDDQDLIWVDWKGGTDQDNYPSLRFRVEDVPRGVFAELGEHDDEVTITNDLHLPVNISGGAGNDDLDGSNLADVIDGAQGNDDLSGGDGPDTLYGADGNDTLNGGKGDDVTDGGKGNDTYVYIDDWGRERLDDPTGTETLDFSLVTQKLIGDSYYGEGDVRTENGASRLSYYESDVEVILGGTNDDTFLFKPTAPNGLRFDGRGGGDTATVQLSNQVREINVFDTGASGVDRVVVDGTASADTFLLRGQHDVPGQPLAAGNVETRRGLPANLGFTALLTGPNVDRVNNDLSIERLTVNGGDGGDLFALDDNVSSSTDPDSTTINGGLGDDQFQVGQIFGDAQGVFGGQNRTYEQCRATPQNPPINHDNDPDTPPVFDTCTGLRDNAVGIAQARDYFGLRDTTRGYLSNGITHPARLNGGDGDDFFQVYSNQAALNMQGEFGDDTFILRAFALEGSISAVKASELGIDIGGGEGADYVQYANNAKVTIDGGPGFNTLIMVGTEFGDGILIADGSAMICPIKDFDEGTLKTGTDPQTGKPYCAFDDVTYSNIQSVGIQALGGNDLVLALSTTPGAQTQIFGGDNDDVVYFGRNPATDDTKRTEHGGDLTGIQGPLSVFGESDPTFDESIPAAITLPGETAGAAEPPSPLASGTNDGDVGIIDARQNLTGGNDTGSIDEITFENVQVLNLTGFGTGPGETIRGRQLPAGIVFDAIDFVDLRAGDGTDNVTVNGTHDLLRDLDDDDDEEDAPDFLPFADMNPLSPVVIILDEGGETHAAPMRVQGEGGADVITVKDVDVATRVLGGDGDDVISVGSEEPAGPSTLETMRARVEVRGGNPTASDTLYVDDAAETASQTLYVDQDDIFGLGLHPLGLHYTEIETLDINLGSAAEVVNVLGTTAATTVHGNVGDERYYVGAAAAPIVDLYDPATPVIDDLDEAAATQYLVRHLDDIDGNLSLDSGAGRHILMASDVTTATGDPAGVITDTTITGMSTGAITYTTSPTAGNWADGVTVWASELNDGIALNGAHQTAGVRTITTLDAGGGNDAVTVDVDEIPHDFAVVNGEEGDDVIDGAASDAGLVVFGDLGRDTITTGSGKDVVLGDRGRVNYGAVTTMGGGGPGDRTDGLTTPALFSVLLSDNTATPVGGDTISLGGGDDVALGQQGADTIDGGDGNDELTGGQNGNGATNDVAADPDDDVIHGGAGNDRIAGDNAKVEPTRDVRLFDVEVGSTVAPVAVHGADTIHGDGGDDLVFGQGDGDLLHGDLGLDYLEGNAGADTAFGGGGEDDITGGGSAIDGLIVPDRVGTGLRDLGDRLFGDDSTTAVDGATDSHDVIAGDNARIVYASQLTPPSGANYTARRLRTVTLFDAAAGDTSGTDWIRGNGGEDDLYGQFDDGMGAFPGPVSCVDGRVIPPASISGDVICGDGGHDGVLGDRGTIESRTAEAMRPAGAQQVTTQSPFIDETIYVRGTVIRVVTLDPIAAGGHDMTFGGDGNDYLHPGFGNDFVNAGAGDDAVFGAGGDDAIWGDVGHDRMYGGFGRDAIDVKPRGAFAGRPADPAIWSIIAPLVDTDGRLPTTNESDTIYGGWDPDQLQADEGGAGPRPGDRIVDWQGAYNAYFVCEGAYGAGRAIREISPNLVTVLQTLATGDGATDVLTRGSSGEVELALVYQNQIRQNTNPTHPDHPAHFTCESLP